MIYTVSSTYNGRINSPIIFCYDIKNSLTRVPIKQKIWR